MKVYIVMDTGGYNENVVDRVFSTVDKAVEYVIKSKFAGNFAYVNMDIGQIKKNALPFIDEFEVDE